MWPASDVNRKLAHQDFIESCRSTGRGIAGNREIPDDGALRATQSRVNCVEGLLHRAAHPTRAELQVNTLIEKYLRIHLKFIERRRAFAPPPLRSRSHVP